MRKRRSRTSGNAVLWPPFTACSQACHVHSQLKDLPHTRSGPSLTGQKRVTQKQALSCYNVDSFFDTFGHILLKLGP
jgi:hypothetical protein